MELVKVKAVQNNMVPIVLGLFGGDREFYAVTPTHFKTLSGGLNKYGVAEIMFHGGVVAVLHTKKERFTTMRGTGTQYVGSGLTEIGLSMFRLKEIPRMVEECQGANRIAKAIEKLLSPGDESPIAA
jgi:hypothetical protein